MSVGVSSGEFDLVFKYGRAKLVVELVPKITYSHSLLPDVSDVGHLFFVLGVTVGLQIEAGLQLLLYWLNRGWTFELLTFELFWISCKQMFGRIKLICSFKHIGRVEVLQLILSKHLLIQILFHLNLSLHLFLLDFFKCINFPPWIPIIPYNTRIYIRFLMIVFLIFFLLVPELNVFKVILLLFQESLNFSFLLNIFLFCIVLFKILCLLLIGQGSILQILKEHF